MGFGLYYGRVLFGSTLLRGMFSRLTLRLVLLPILVAACLRAVGTTGSIVGTVVDPREGRVASVKILVRNQNTGSERTTETNGLGEYTVQLLRPGLYSVTVEKAGFRKAERQDVELHVDQTARIDFVLELGQVVEEIEVRGAAPLIEADTSSLGQVVGRRKVSELPLNERNFLSFTLLVPGAQLPAEGSENARQGGAISVNGAREKSNNFLLDGVDNNDPTLNQYSVLPAVEAIEEFKVQSSNSSAEFGRSGGAQINMVLKSGTNDLHGSLFEFVRNRHLDAKNFFDRPDCETGVASGTCGEIPRFDRNQFGGSLGGPIARDKAFWFLAYEQLQLREANTRQSTVPSAVQRQAALDAVPVSERNPAGVALLNLYPLANVGPDLPISNNFLAAPAIRSSISQIVVRADHQLSPKDNFSGHYALYEVDRFDPFLIRAFSDLPGFGVDRTPRGQSARVTWNRVLGGRFVNEARFGLNRLGTSLVPEDNARNVSEKLGFPFFSSDSFLWGTPNVIVAGFESVGAAPIMPQTRTPTTFHWVDNLAWNPDFHGGRHQLKFGTDIRQSRTDMFRPVFMRGNWVFTGRFRRNPLQDLVRGLPTVAVVGRGDPTLSLSSTALNFYLQDDIRISRSLSLNLGLRWDYSSPPVDTRDRLSTADLSSNSPTCQPKPDCQFIVAGTNGIHRGIFNDDWNNLAPRIGLAWRPFAGSRFVVRSAYGVFFDAATTLQNPVNPPFLTQTVFPNVRGPATIQTIVEPGGPTPPVQGFVVSRDFGLLICSTGISTSSTRSSPTY